MATPTYDLLDSVTLSSSASSVTFSSIDQSYRDLILVAEAKLPGNDYLVFRLNGDSTTGNYPFVMMYGDGSSAVSQNNSASFPDFFVNGYVGDTSVFGIIQIMDYTATDRHKSILTRGNHSGVVNAWGQRYASTSAITSIALYEDGGANLLAGSTFYLYGVAA